MQTLGYKPEAFVTKPAPQFSCTALVGKSFRKISLSDYAGKYVVLFFYPLDNTFVCPTEILSYSEKSPAFAAANCQVIACSVDSQFSHLEWVKKPREEGGLGEMKVPMLADLTHEVGKKYGVYLEEEGVCLRGTFIIDGKGVLRHIQVNDLPVGRNVNETLRLVKAFQHSDIYGEVCPEGWEEGQQTMVPEVGAQKTEEYWKNVHGKKGGHWTPIL